MTETVEVIITAMAHYLPTVAGIAIGYLWNKARSLSKKRDLYEAAERLNLKINLRQLYMESTRNGYITCDDEALAEEIYDYYHKLGGNGQGTKIIEDIRALMKPKETGKTP